MIRVLAPVRQARRLPILVLAMLLLVVVLPTGAGARTPAPEPAPPSIIAGEKPAYPRLDTQLNLLVAQVQAGRPAIAAAQDAPAAIGAAVAVRVRLAGDAKPITSFLDGRGATVASVRGDAIEAYVPVAALAELSEQPGVLSVRAILPPQAQVVSQGVAVHGVPEWQAAGYSGANIKVGIIDVGFINFTQLMGNELPWTVDARCYRHIGVATGDLADCELREEHGTAVAEALTDVAPGARLYISNPQTTNDLNAAVEWMIAQGVQVINHSVSWGFEGPGDGTSPNENGALAAVDKAVAAGITWVNSSGNDGLSTWTGPFSDVDGDGEIEFAPDDERIDVTLYVNKSTTIQMRWEDTWGEAARDLELVLYDANGIQQRISADNQTGELGQDPYEWFVFNPSRSGLYKIGVSYASGDIPGWIEVQSYTRDVLEHHNRTGSVGNPAESANPGLLAVGAAYWATPDQIEDYSSGGPTRDGRVKPDLVGTDGGSSVSYGAFFGTSQAAPHVAGMVTILRQRYPDWTPAQIAEYLKSTAIPTGSPVPNNIWGHGLAHLPPVDAAVNPSPVVNAASPATATTGSGALAVTLTGTGFVPASLAHWNGAQRPTTFVSETHLTVQLSADDLATAGSGLLTVVNPGPGGGTSPPLPFVVAGGSPALENLEFSETWSRTDDPVEQLVVSRTWMWGPQPFTDEILERYAEGDDGLRHVQYFDKSRMEVTTDPTIGPDSIWYVTNGLLSKELITGRMQVGDDSFVDRAPAAVNVAGDPDDPNGPTYATFTTLVDAAALADGATITQRLARDGRVTFDAELAEYEITAAHHVQVPGLNHQVASPFWSFMNATGVVYQDGDYGRDLLFVNPFYATGYPITEAYWTTVRVGGTPTDVLVQCFERRCLTYTPGNAEGWQVEAGNVGRHYFLWRYGMEPT